MDFCPAPRFSVPTYAPDVSEADDESGFDFSAEIYVQLKRLQTGEQLADLGIVSAAALQVRLLIEDRDDLDTSDMTGAQVVLYAMRTTDPHRWRHEIEAAERAAQLQRAA